MQPRELGRDCFCFRKCSSIWARKETVKNRVRLLMQPGKLLSVCLSQPLAQGGWAKNASKVHHLIKNLRVGKSDQIPTSDPDELMKDRGRQCYYVCQHHGVGHPHGAWSLSSDSCEHLVTAKGWARTNHQHGGYSWCMSAQQRFIFQFKLLKTPLFLCLYHKSKKLCSILPLKLSVEKQSSW